MKGGFFEELLREGPFCASCAEALDGIVGVCNAGVLSVHFSAPFEPVNDLEVGVAGADGLYSLGGM